MTKVFITAQGAAMKTNNWTEGQEISCSDAVAELFIAKGIATSELLDGKAAVTDKKTNKKKTE